MGRLSRRHVLGLALGSAVGGAASACWLRALEDTITRRTGWALGASVSITVIHRDRRQAEQALAAAIEELAEVERLLSLYQPESAICRLNRDGILDEPHPAFVEVLQAAQTMSERTGGAFDCTVQPLWELYAAADLIGQPPDEKAIAEAKSRVDWRRVEISSRRIRLRGEGTAITLNGIAQGYAADRVRACLERHGIEHAMIDAGEVGSLGTKADGRPWSVGIQHPREKDAYLAVAELAGRCLSTSGDYATQFACGEHHLFDPRTGRSPAALSSVSVAAATACEADALSTAVFVLGPEEGLELIRQTAAADALLVLKSGRTLATEGFPAALA